MTRQVQQGHNLNAQLIRLGNDGIHLVLGQIALITAAVLCHVARLDLRYNSIVVIGCAVGSEGHIIQQEAQAIVAEGQLELVIAIVLHLIEQRNDPFLAEILSAAVQMYNLVLNVSRSIGCRSLNLTALGLLPVRGLVHHRGLLRLGSGHIHRRVVHCTGRGIGHVGSHCGNRQSAEHQHRREQDRKESGKFLFHGLLALLY